MASSAQHKSACLLAALLFAGTIRAAPAQALPDDASIASEAARQVARSGTAIDKAERQARQLRQALPEVATPPMLAAPDPAAVAQRYAATLQQDDTALFIMVSFSMPSESIERLAAQADKAGATLVLRGVVDGSLQRTAEIAGQFIKKYPRAQFQIDPNLFKRFAVDRVPAFVLSVRAQEAAACGKDCDAGNTFASVAGDVTLDYALEYLAKQRDQRFSALAERRLKQLRGAL